MNTINLPNELISIIFENSNDTERANLVKLVHEKKSSKDNDIHMTTDTTVWQKSSSNLDLNCELLLSLKESGNKSLELLNSKLPTPYEIQGINWDNEKLSLSLNRSMFFRYFLNREFLSKPNENRNFIVRNVELRRLEYSNHLNCERVIETCKMLHNFFKYNILSDKCSPINVGCADPKDLPTDGIPCHVGIVKVDNEIPKGVSLAGYSNKIRKIYTEIYNEKKQEDIPEHIVYRNIVHSTANDTMFQLFAVNLSHPCNLLTKQISNDCKIVQYNYARMVHLLKSYTDEFGELSDEELKNIDVSHLKENEEWTLGFCILENFDKLLREMAEESLNGIFNIHRIHHLLIDASNEFSRYYNRVRILVKEPKDHQMASMKAKIYFVSSLKKLFESCFKLINISPIRNM